MQPQIATAASLLIAGYAHDGVLLNLFGHRDADKCVITSVVDADSQIDIIEDFPESVLCGMDECVADRLSREASEANAEARAERYQWHREFLIA